MTERALCPHVAVLAALLVLAGCTASVVTSDAAESERRTANFVFDNPGYEAYDVTVYVVETPPNESGIPLSVTMENGTTRTVNSTSSGPPLPSDVLSDAVEMEPTSGTLATASHRLPERSSLHIAVENVPANATALTVVWRTDESRPEIRTFGRSSALCTGDRAEVTTLAPTNTSGVTCGGLGNASSSDSVVRHTVSANRTESSA